MGAVERYLRGATLGACIELPSFAVELEKGESFSQTAARTAWLSYNADRPVSALSAVVKRPEVC